MALLPGLFQKPGSSINRKWLVTLAWPGSCSLFHNNVFLGGCLRWKANLKRQVCVVEGEKVICA